MADVILDIYVHPKYGLVVSPSNLSPKILPTPVAGDAWGLKIFYLDSATPPMFHRYAGSNTVVQFRARGINHVYASTATSIEIEPATGATVTRLQAGTNSKIERQRVLFNNPNASGGTFAINFVRGNANSSPLPGRVSLGGSTANAELIALRALPFGATAAQIVAVMKSIPGWRYYTQAGDVESSNTSFNDLWPGGRLPAVSLISGGFDIEYGSLAGAYNTWTTGIGLCSINDAGVFYPWGWDNWTGLFASDFNDFFLPQNGPAFLEIFRDGQLVAEHQFTAAPATSNAPSFTSPQLVGSGTVGQPFTHSFFATGFPIPTYAVAPGSALPGGVTLNAGTGILSGTPTQSGSFTGTVVATNGIAPDATQPYVIQIGSGGPPPPPPPPPPGDGGVGGPSSGPQGPLLNYLDGNFNNADVSDGVWFETFDEWPGLVVWHIPITMKLDAYNALGQPGIGSFETPFGYFWKDTPWRYLGANLIQFERIRHNLPADANRRQSASKNYQIFQPTFSNGQIVAQAINSFTRNIKVNCNYHYAIDDPGDLPVIPVIQMIPWLTGLATTDFGTGFPQRNDLPVHPLYSDNFGNSAIDGGGIRHVFGRLFCRLTLTG